MTYVYAFEYSNHVNAVVCKFTYFPSPAECTNMSLIINKVSQYDVSCSPLSVNPQRLFIRPKTTLVVVIFASI